MGFGSWIPVETTIMIDAFFLLAAASLGWGLSLATYRLFATRNDWPMGQVHTDLPFIPVLIGTVTLVIGLIFAAARGTEYGGWIIIAIGVLLAVFWTGFLRVGSQVSMFLAPAAAAILLLGFLGFPFPGNYDVTPGSSKVRELSPSRIEDRILPPARR